MENEEGAQGNMIEGEIRGSKSVELPEEKFTAKVMRTSSRGGGEEEAKKVKGARKPKGAKRSTAKDKKGKTAEQSGCERGAFGGAKGRAGNERAQAGGP